MKEAARSGAVAALAVLALLFVSLMPSRLSVAMRVRGGTGFERATKAFAGTALDFSVALPWVSALVGLGVLVFALTRWRRAQQLAALVVAVPFSISLFLLTVMQQEVKAERGAFTTMHEIVEALGQASFVEGTLDFIRYERIWVPLVLCGVLALVVLAAGARRRDVVPWRGWAPGFGATLLAGMLAAQGLVFASSQASPRLTPAAVGDPLSSLLETTLDLLRHQAPLAPSELLMQQTFTPDEVATGAARMGWPARRASGPPCHPYARPLDRTEEPAPPGARLLASWERVSELLFADEDEKVALFQFSLESFRADDLHALNPNAPAVLHPFVNGLSAGRPGVLAGRRMYQAGVRSAQGLAAMTCGVGTLPYNLSIIRDFEDFPLRCATDVWADAGFEGRFFYGSDPGFDGMARFLGRHGVKEVVSQDELPTTLPKGAWGGLTDFALFDEAVKRVQAGLGERPQYALVMSLSNHSPYTPPEDLPKFVSDRVDEGMASVPNRATIDDRRRLLTHAYVDAALERFFAALDATKLAERSIVVLMADHSTGEDYVWGPKELEHETDEAKTQVPFLVVIPEAFLARVKDRPALEAALAEAQRELNAQPLSQNDVPAMLLALLRSHPGVRALPKSARWHTLGGQVTSPWFRSGDPDSFLVGINGVDQLYTLDARGVRVGAYEDAVFLRTRAERSSVTPRLIPVAATLVETLRSPSTCAP